MSTVQATKTEVVREVDGKKLYKVLVKGKSCHGGNMKWKEVGVWHHFDGTPEMCKRGFHLTTMPYQTWFKWGCTVYEAEAKNIIQWQDDKCVCTDVRLVRKLPKHASIRKAEQFIKSLKKIPWFKPDGKPLPEWKLYTADTWDAAWDVAWDAAWDVARDAAQNVARDTAWAAARDAALDAAQNVARDTAWAAARDAALDAAWNAARAAAWAAARDGALDAAWNAARDTAWDAARDAALLTVFLVCKHLPVEDKKKHFAHTKARMQVWQKGYGLLCDVNGVLYVYAKKVKPQ